MWIENFEIEFENQQKEKKDKNTSTIGVRGFPVYIKKKI